MRIRLSLGSCFVLLLSTSVFAQSRGYPEGIRKGNILYVNLPSDLPKENLESAGEGTKARLYQLTASLARREPRAEDVIVVFVDRNGRTVFPNREAAASQHQTRGATQLQSNALTTASASGNQLTFTFNSPDYPWTAAEVTSLSSALNTFYPVIRDIYGDPAFDNIVNVRKDPTAGPVGLYYPAFNEIVLKAADGGMD